jgi:hypothetical protein
MSSKMAIITFLDGSGGSIDNTLPGGPVYPGHGLPGGGYPDQSLPPGAAQLPVYPFDPTVPDQGLPGSQPGVDNTLPGSGRPSQPIAPGGRFVVKWFACKGLILVPDNTLPPTPEPK